MPALPDAGDLVPWRMLKPSVERMGCCNLPFFKIPDLFVIGRMQFVLLLRDPLVGHLIHLLSSVGQAGGDDSGRRYLRLQLFNPGASFRKFAVPFP